MKRYEFEELPTIQKARWIALFEAVNIICNKADNLKVKQHNVQLKPVYINTFIDEMSHGINKKLESFR